MTGIGSLLAQARRTYSGASALTGQASTTASGTRLRTGSSFLLGASQSQIVPRSDLVASVGLLSQSGTIVSGGRIKTADGLYSGSSGISVDSVSTLDSSVSLSVSTMLVGAGYRTRNVTIPLLTNSMMSVLAGNVLVGLSFLDGQSDAEIIAYLIDFIPTVDFFFEQHEMSPWFIKRGDHFLNEIAVGGQWFVPHDQYLLKPYGGKPFFVRHDSNNEDLP
jgi:hypothetical protein